MTEIKLWHPELPNKTGIQKVETGIVVTNNLYRIISKDDPSLRLGGLPAHHLKRIAIYAQKSPNWLIEKISADTQDFVDRCNNFDLDIVSKEAFQLNVDLDPHIQNRRVEAIVNAIVRGQLDSKQYIRKVSKEWRNEIEENVQEYRTGIKVYAGLRAEDLFKTD